MKIASFEAIFETQDSLSLPAYPGSVLRGGFGSAFRHIACPFRDKECPKCLLRDKCIYSYIFETPLPQGSRIMRKYPYVPHPFILEPPWVGVEAPSQLGKGNPFTMNLVLIGKAADYLPYFIYALDEMGSRGLGKGRGKLKLVAVKQEKKTIYDGGRKTLEGKPAAEEIRFNRPRARPKAIRLIFQSPTRIVHQGKPTQRLDFHILIRSLLRRISLLAYFHCGETLPIDFQGLIKQASAIRTESLSLHWYRWGRYSRRQDQEIPMDGLLGDATYAGDLAPFLPYLRAGEILHVGKGTAFGMGKYKLELPSSLRRS